MFLYNNRKKRLRQFYKGLFVFITLFLCFFVIANIVIPGSMKPYVVSFGGDDFPPADAVLILGAMVYSDGRLSQAVQERADSAIALRKAGKAKKILISGDNRTAYYDEVTTIKNYLFSKNIPKEVIFLDFAGLDTYDSVYRAQYIFQVTSLRIPTQSFHVDRAVFLARSIGIDAYGIVADTDHLPGLSRLQVREFFARGKAMRDILVDSGPRHFGDKIPITGVSNSL